MSVIEELTKQQETEKCGNMLRCAMQELTKTELRAFGMRFALDGGAGATWKQIADALGLEHERAAIIIVNDTVERLQRAVGSSTRDLSLMSLSMMSLNMDSILECCVQSTV